MGRPGTLGSVPLIGTALASGMIRTTPTYAVTPWIVNERKAAGINKENILSISAFETHRPMTAHEIQKKPGREIASRYP